MSIKTLISAGMAVVAFAASPAFAQTMQPASVFVVHGIPGRDVASTLDPLLPVDVKVNGNCLIQGLNFGNIKGPFQIPEGGYTIKIGLADTLAPCSAGAVITAHVSVKAGETAAVVAALSPTGAPTGYKFAIDLSTVNKNKNRLFVAHAAEAPAVNVLLSQNNSVVAKVRNLEPGKAFNDVVPSGKYSATVKPFGSSVTVLGPERLVLSNRGSTLVFAVGSAASGSLKLLTKDIPSVF